MNQPEKPFCCREIGCGESFTNADRLAVHSKKHDLVLQLGNKGGSFVADQTPTPTRFIKNCEDVGLFQDLQNVNIFEDSFKREMESRSSMNSLSLDNHLTATSTAADDTLHTPHIFPHITNDNGLNLYNNKTDDQLNTPVRSLSNDTSTKCLTSCTEDNIPTLSNDNRYYTIKNDDGKKGKRSQLKLVRQNSVDIVDSESSNLMNKEVTNNNIEDIVVPMKQGLKSRRIIQCNNLKEIHLIPTISISDSCKNESLMDNQNIVDEPTIIDGSPKFSVKNENSTKNSLLTVPDVDKNSLKNSVNNNFNKLISQKSIDMALANFTREAAQKTHDMHSISIEDIDEMNNETCIKNSSILIDKNLDNITSNRSIIENETSVINPNLLNSNIVYNNKRKTSFEISNDDISKHPFILNEKNTINHIDPLQSQVSNKNHVRQSVIFQKDNNQIQNVDKINDNRYELLLKWPGGKKVYLKEVYRDDDPDEKSTLSTSPKTIPDSISIIDDKISSASVKRKLHDTIQANKKPIPTNFKVPIKQINKSQNSPNVLKDCIISPQVLITNKLISPHIITNQVSVLPVRMIPLTEPSICTNLNVVNIDSKSVSKNDSKSVSKNVGKSKNVDDKNCDKTGDPNNKDNQKKACIQVRNRAAVNRYRIRKQQWQLMLERKNQFLEMENKHLTTKLSFALQEVKRLNNIIASHSNCSVSIQLNNNVGVIKPTELNVGENSKSNQTMVIVQNNKKSSNVTVSSVVTHQQLGKPQEHNI